MVFSPYFGDFYTKYDKLTNLETDRSSIRINNQLFRYFTDNWILNKIETLILKIEGKIKYIFTNYQLFRFFNKNELE
jgi:hypothetical protein